MLIRDWMTRDVITVSPRGTIQEALNLLMENHISILPVIDDGKIVGILTDRDIKHALPSDACLLDFQNIMYHVARLSIDSIMSPNPITVAEDKTVEEAAEILLDNKISGAPVVDDHGKLKGIVTKADLFSALISLTGVAEEGMLYAFRLEDVPGSIKSVTDIIRSYGARLGSIVSTYESAPKGFRDVYIRSFDVDRSHMEDLEKELSSKAKILYIIDHKENKRRIFEDR